MSTLEDLSALVERVTAKNAPTLYRRHYGIDADSGALRIPDWNSWHSLPFIDKALLQNIPIEERVFIEWGDINSIHASSGTSGRPPHFSPWVRLDGYEYRTRFHTFTRPALCSMPIHHQHEKFLDQFNVNPKLIVFDPRRARASVELARLADVDSLFIFTGHLTLIGPEAERLGIGKNIRFIELAGESCSRSLYNYAKRVFPNAVIVSFYGATEVENPPITYPCRPLSDAEPLEVHHPRDGYYIELIHPDTRELLPVQAGTEGEIVITADITRPGKPAVSPLVRYRTGDMARVFEEKCPMHGTWSFTMPGRVAMDFIKIPGGILRAEEIERVLRSIGNGISDVFELHFKEIEDAGTVKIRIELFLETTGVVDFEPIAREIEKRTHVGATFTYADGIARGMYLPITCTPFKLTFRGKRKRMMRDTS